MDRAKTGTAEAQGFGLAFKFHIWIAAGQFMVDVNVTRGAPGFLTLRNLVEANLRNVTDTIGYLHGVSIDIDMISAANLETNERHFFPPGIPVLVQRRQIASPVTVTEDGLLGAIGKDPYAHTVMADFREAMRNPYDTGFFCYRAIEAMMQSMKTSSDEDEKTSWPRLRGTLHVDIGAIQNVQKHAVLRRHGKTGDISGEEREKVLVITDEITRRYLAYLTRGKTPLPEADFPMFMG
jgi:hypothetical protein